MLNTLAPVRSLLIAIFILMAGSGFLATLIALRLERAGHDTMVIGAVATAYFLGLVIGALRGGLVVRRVGHIRAFAAFVALLSASTLAYALVQHPQFWGVLRLIDGFCVAGVFICLESWLNDKAETNTRGGILAGYMVALYSGQALGQLLLSAGGSLPAVPFQIASILISLAIIPLCLTRSSAPAPPEASDILIKGLLHRAPLGVVGTVATGLMLGAFYGMAAVQVRRFGLDLDQTALFMMLVILGGVALQWPLGHLSDRFDRRRVIVWSFGATMATSLALAITAAPGLALLVLGAAFGGLSFALYPICVAHSNDRLPEKDRVGASGGLVLLYSAGAALGPMGAASMMSLMEAVGLNLGGVFLFIALCAGGAMGFGLWRQSTATPVPDQDQQDFQILVRTTPVAVLLDPHVPEEDGTGSTHNPAQGQ